MWATIRVIRLFVKSLKRIADALEDLRDLYKLELESRGIRRFTAAGSAPNERVEVMYGHIDEQDD